MGRHDNVSAMLESHNGVGVPLQPLELGGGALLSSTKNLEVSTNQTAVELELVTAIDTELQSLALPPVSGCAFVPEFIQIAVIPVNERELEDCTPDIDMDLELQPARCQIDFELKEMSLQSLQASISPWRIDLQSITNIVRQENHKNVLDIQFLTGVPTTRLPEAT